MASPEGGADHSVSKLAGGVVIAFAALTPFGDVGPTTAAAGVLGGHVSLLLVPLLAVLLPSDSLKGATSPFLRLAAVALYVGTFVTLVSLLVLPVSFRGEELFEKGLRVGFTLVLWVMALHVTARAYRVARAYLAIGLAVALTLSLIVLWGSEVLGLFDVDDNPLLHATANVQQRPRILSSESSLAGASLVAEAGALLLCVRSPRRWLIPITVAVAVSLPPLDSKGTTTAVLAAAGLVILGTVLGRSFRSGVMQRVLVGGGIVVSLGAFLLARSLLSAFVGSDPSKALSEATRSAWSVAALESLEDAPWGHGFAAPLVHAADWLADAKADLAPFFGPSAWVELSGLIQGTTDYALAPKTLPASLAIYLGVFGVALWLLLTGLVLRDIGRRLASRGVTARTSSFGLLFALIATNTYVTGLYEAALIILFGIALAGGSGQYRPPTEAAAALGAQPRVEAYRRAR